MSIGTVLTGEEFNKIYNGVEFYKFLNDDLIHYNFKYNIGLNVDTIPFNPRGKCSKGGLYFCKKSKCHLFVTEYGHKMALIEIPNNALIYIEEDKFKADKLIITKINDFEDVLDDFWIELISKNGRALEFVKDQTKEICKLAIL